MHFLSKVIKFCDYSIYSFTDMGYLSFIWYVFCHIRAQNNYMFIDIFKRF